MESLIVQLIDKSQDALVAGDLDTYLSMLADDVEMHDPAAPRLRGREQVRQYLDGLLAALGSIRFAERRIYATGRSAAMWFVLELTTRSGASARLEGVDVFELDDSDRIARIASYYDPSSLAALQ